MENNNWYDTKSTDPKYDLLAAEIDEILASNATESSNSPEKIPSYLALMQINGKYDQII